MKRLLSFLVVILISTVAFAQSVTLTFTAKDAANQHVQLHRVSITNLTKGWQETIYWPDTTLTMQNGTGIADVETLGRVSLQMSQNNPNPFTGTTEVNLMVTNEGSVALDIADINGRIVVANDYALQPGPHQFRITLATAGTYVMTARQSGQTSSIKMVCNGGTDANMIEYAGSVATQDFVSLQSPKSQNTPKYTTTHPFTFGDQMEYVGYASINGSEAESQHITQEQNASQTIVLQFAETVGNPYDGQPCSGAATVTDIDNNTYNTVQIGNQCWMKENLRTTQYADGTSIALGSSTSTTTAYRYYPNNDQSNVPTYGYLYNWPAVMGNSSTSSANPSGVQGICPTGWHVPSDAEWTQLTDYVSSQSQYVCGGDSAYIAKALASTTGWNSYTVTCVVGNNPSNNNATGFSALPAGGYLSPYEAFGYRAYFWSASEDNDYIAYTRVLGYKYAAVYKSDYYKNYAFSVRCVRD
jgi:uncharacterized protein (TIGR02145 family)